MVHPLIDAETLRQELESETPPLVLDCRVRLGDPQAGAALWRQAHVPGSLHLDLDRDLSGPSDGPGGRHPLPTQSDFAASLQRLGVSPQQPLVVVDDTSGQLAAARAWWMLSIWAGHPHVRLLDGGLGAWEEIAGDWEVGEAAPREPSSWQPEFDTSGIVSLKELVASNVLKVDARAGERFRGEVEPLDPRAGHIPGAVSRPCSLNLDEHGRFKPAEALDRELPQADSIVAYCGSGVTACHNLLAYRLAGRPLPRLYVGSWSEWSSDPALPAEVGPVSITIAGLTWDGDR